MYPNPLTAAGLYSSSGPAAVFLTNLLKCPRDQAPGTAGAPGFPFIRRRPWCRRWPKTDAIVICRRQRWRGRRRCCHGYAQRKTRRASFWWVNYAWFPARTQAALDRAGSREGQPGRKRLIQLPLAVTSQRSNDKAWPAATAGSEVRHFGCVLAKYEIRAATYRASVKTWLESLSWPACADGSRWHNLFVR